MGTPPVGAGRSRAHPAYEWDRPTRTPTARIVLSDPVPPEAAAPAGASRRRPSRSGARARRGSSELLLCAAEALFCGVGDIPPHSSVPGPCGVVAAAPSCSRSPRPRAKRRRSSIARFRAVATIHPAGLGGMPSLRHRPVATANASCTASSASVMSPKTRISVATAWPYASRNTRSTPVASPWAATAGVTP